MGLPGSRYLIEGAGITEYLRFILKGGSTVGEEAVFRLCYGTNRELAALDLLSILAEVPASIEYFAGRVLTPPAPFRFDHYSTGYGSFIVDFIATTAALLYINEQREVLHRYIWYVRNAIDYMIDVHRRPGLKIPSKVIRAIQAIAAPVDAGDSEDVVIYVLGANDQIRIDRDHAELIIMYRRFDKERAVEREFYLTEVDEKGYGRVDNNLDYRTGVATSVDGVWYLLTEERDVILLLRKNGGVKLSENRRYRLGGHIRRMGKSEFLAVKRARRLD